MEEDNELMSLAKSGDKNAFEQLVLKYRISAIKYAEKNVKDEYIAEDIVQDSFISIYLNKEQYKNEYNFKAYLFKIIRNKSIDYIRRENKKSFKEVELSAPSSEKEFLDNYDQKRFRKNFNQLKDEYKKVLYLYAYDGISYKGIASILNKSLSQVKVMIYRARKKLSKIMEDDEC